MGIEKPQQLLDDPYHKYFLSKTWNCKLTIDYQVDSSTSGGDKECEDVAEEAASSGEEPSRFIRLLELEVVTSSPPLFDTIEKIATDLSFIVVVGFEVETGVPVTFAFPGGMKGPEYHTHSFEGLSLLDVEQNYSVGVIKVVRAFLDYAGEITHGIVLVSGPVGTGKSYLIRSILTEMKQRRAIICTPPTTFLIQAGLLAQVVANFRKSTIVLEDVGEVIAADAASIYMDARSNLLNFSEGFLSLLTDSVIVISFNYEIDKIDPAILRPGRCLANINVGELSYEHAQKLVSFKIPNRSYTLADVYELNRVKNADFLVKPKHIGLIK